MKNMGICRLDNEHIRPTIVAGEMGEVRDLRPLVLSSTDLEIDLKLAK